MHTVIYVFWLLIYHAGENLHSLDGIGLMWWPCSQIMQAEYVAMHWYETAYRDETCSLRAEVKCGRADLRMFQRVKCGQILQILYADVTDKVRRCGC